MHIFYDFHKRFIPREHISICYSFTCASDTVSNDEIADIQKDIIVVMTSFSMVRNTL